VSSCLVIIPMTLPFHAHPPRLRHRHRKRCGLAVNVSVMHTSSCCVGTKCRSYPTQNRCQQNGTSPEDLYRCVLTNTNLRTRQNKEGIQQKYHH
jgi:hypothetical protein